ncbi:TonB-dependent receptor [Sinomicrobium sp. FJxs]|uniref:TonB-dependent receptor n=2 Tax=Sinomicrobium weinanense TaxID=2842200 RepID=A0A926JVA2_9FLAO|nr:TonB-dependent receptor [Sinomicrobium weinanense]MBC9798212.1 TonB-dependent receptor [Sinomicrobium weinanense]MBU3122870.1 TonB-dependent receptor [Sinomicrobium weinanense]
MQVQRLLFVFALSLYAISAEAQNTLSAIIRDSENQEVLPGANAYLKGTSTGAVADENGRVTLRNIPDGKQVIIFSYIGFEEHEETLSFPLQSSAPLNIFLAQEGEHMEEVVITATRSSRTIADLPTRVEAISGEELAEKGNMKPGDIRMLLNESTGIQTQQTSATSYNSSIRIQGLDGKYTQILKDGFPLYSGFSGGLSLLQIPPLDLKQVEVIKGSSSTLYGGGAIAGLVNLVSRTPGEEERLDLLLNGTSALGLDASAFYSRRSGKTGLTVFAAYNMGSPYDPSDEGFTAIPEFDRYTLNPNFFLYFNDRTTLRIGLNATIEDRTGGDEKYIKGKGNEEHSFFEKNETNRISSQLELQHTIDTLSGIAVKNSFSYYDRSLKIPSFSFSGTQFSSFNEATYHRNGKKADWIIGLNLWTDRFDQDKADTTTAVDYTHVTFGGFVQNTWNLSEKVILETGLRGDYQNKYGFFLLPRTSLLFKINPKLTSRLGGGLGYKTPTVFTEDAERIYFRGVLPIDEENTEAERSAGINFDVNYRTPLSDRMSFNINTLFFYTKVNDPLILSPVSDGLYAFEQPDGYVDTRGIEINTKLAYDDFKLFIGYTFADVREHYDGNITDFPLVAKHRLNNVLMYEVEDNIKIGLEAYYYSPQTLNDGTRGRDYWICGIMTEKIWDRFSIFLNFENLLDTRQTKFGSIYTGPVSDPVFKDIYAPLDGFVINGGIKLKLL